MTLPSVSAPKGGGAIRGIGEKFGANPATGTGAFTVPIATSPGRSEFGPQLVLTYDSGAGNGPFGFGWSLSLASISRKTDKGLPRYGAGDDEDVYLLSGAEDLVPVLRPDGTRLEDKASHPGFTVHRFVPRVDGLFARIERWIEDATGGVHWRSISRDNVTSIYGRTNASRIFDPAETGAAEPRRIFEWLICESHDDKGNAIVYDYAAEDDGRVRRTRPNERNRERRANRYPKRIRYGNRVSRLVQPDLSVAEWLFEVVFDYDEDHYAPLPPDPATPVDQQHPMVQASIGSGGDWRVRPDPFSRYRPGFELRSYRRCRRVLMFHRFAELGPDPCLVRSTEFDYADLADYETAPPPALEAELDHQGSTRYASVIRKVVQSGYVRDPARAVEDRGGRRYVTYRKKSIPDLEFEYSKAQVQDEVHRLEDESLANLPAGVDGQGAQWVDLDGEGLSGILTRQGAAWHYKPNLGGGTFGAMETLPSQPSLFAGAEGGEQLLDLSGDGQLDVVSFAGTAPGFYERTFDPGTGRSGWAAFRAFRQLPTTGLRDPDARFVDLTGDGHADVLITGDEVFTWYTSLAEDGFEAAGQVAQPWDEEAGPRLVFADGTDAVYLADMSGDGLSDFLRIRNGEVAYWPNLGYGRFGAKVAMDNAPVFDHPDQFAHARLRLADIDGSGTNDILYLGADGVRIYFNQSGNGWSEARRLDAFPPVDALSSVTTTDLLGNGTACLVWSSPLAADAGSPIRYVDLMGGQKPHLLVRSVNNMGAETQVTYAPSTKFYLDDKRRGQPWITRLPFPVHVVERIETFDRIGKSRFVTRYAYHHGHFDGYEREFRGFGMVEQYDTEEFAALSASDVFPAGANVDAASHVPPVLTKTWFHTGVYLGRDHVSTYFAGLLDTRDLGEYFREPGLTDAQARDLLLDDTVLPPGLTEDEEREACRALRGSVLRREVYALDHSERQSLPYTVTESNFGLKVLQPRGMNRHAVVFKHPREEVVYNYERALFPVLAGQIVDAATPGAELRLDPRVAHTLTLEVDDTGNVLKAADIAYGRRFSDPALVQEGRDAQARTLAVFTENRVTNGIDTAFAHRVPLVSEARTFELTGYAPGGASGRFRVADLVTEAGAPVATVNAVFDGELGYEEAPTGGRQRRLVEHVRTLYRRDDLAGALPLGQLEPMALPFEAYTLALTPGIVHQVFNENGAAARVTDAILGGSGTAEGAHYVHTRDETGQLDAIWWTPSGRVFYSPGTGDTAAQELAHAQAHFFLPHRTRDPFHTAAAGTESHVTYDDYALLVRETRDTFGNRNTVGERAQDPTQPLVKEGQDYRVLQAALVMDPNRNRSTVAFDALGMVVGTAVMGKPEDNPAPGDRLTAAFKADPTRAELDAFFADPKGPIAAQLLDEATSRVVMDLDAYAREPVLDAKPPVYAAVLARTTHVGQPLPPGGLRIPTSFVYSDGFGREVQKKVQAEPGPVPVRDATGKVVLDANGQPQMTPNDVTPRLTNGGWTVFNNKGLPVRQYEPHFTDRHRFEFDVRVGKSPVQFYDPVERVVATLHPDRSWEKIVIGPWRNDFWDASDTVLIADPTGDGDVGDFFARLPASEHAPTWHGLRTDAAHSAALAARYPDAVLRANETAAARQSEICAGTPTVGHVDPLGRGIVTVAHNRVKHSNAPEPPPEFLATRTVFDIEGNERALVDPMGRVMVRYAYDMAGRRIHLSSMDAGRRWYLGDVAGKPLYVWDGRGHRMRSTYDVLRRQTGTLLREGAGTEALIERSVYGEAQATPEAKNLRGRVAELFDQAGVVAIEGYDFKGNVEASARRLADTVQVNGAAEPAYKTRIDWAGAVTLQAGRFVNRARFDAFNRPIQIVAPHSDDASAKINVIQPGYNDANLLERVDVWLEQGAEPGALIDAAATAPSPTVGVEDIDYDAKAQRASVAHKSGVVTTYGYDPETYRLVRLTTEDTGTGRRLQALDYTFDVAGNVTHVRDTAQQTVFFANARVEASARYTYDALFRLVEATGREHLGQTGGAPIPHSYNDAPRVGRAGLPHPSDGQALGTYLERYLYDQVGNITSLRHSGTDPMHAGWTRDYTCAEPSLLEPGKPGNRLTSTTVGNGAGVTATYSTAGDGYDAHGNMLKMPHLKTVAWNERDLLRMSQRQAVNASDAEGTQRQGERTWYVYAASGERIRKVTELASGQVKDERLYLDGFEVYRRTAGNLVRETLHIMDDTQRVAMIETRTKGAEPGIPRTLVRYQLGNHLGSACLEVNEQAQVLSYEEYTPYGSTAYQAVRSHTQTPKRYRFTGKERDEESGLSYHSARYYAPWLGRWLSADPEALRPPGPEDEERQSRVDLIEAPYRYADADPVALTDPSGRDPVSKIFTKVIRRLRRKGASKHAAKLARREMKNVGSRLAGSLGTQGIPRDVFKHIALHFAKSDKPAHTIFAAGFRESKKLLTESIQKTLKNPSVAPHLSTTETGHLAIVFERKFGREVGEAGEKFLRVVVDHRGRLITAFPAEKALETVTKSGVRIAVGRAVLPSVAVMFAGVKEARAEFDESERKIYEKRNEGHWIEWFIPDIFVSSPLADGTLAPVRRREAAFEAYYQESLRQIEEMEQASLSVEMRESLRGVLELGWNGY